MVGEIWRSFQRLPLWVRLWMVLVLAPVNIAPVFFLDAHPSALWVAALSMAGMAFNLPILLRDRGFSAALAFPHLVFWTPLVVLLILRPAMFDEVQGSYATLLVVLLVVNVVSLAFDGFEAVKWVKGERGIS
ncbi:hypothetical protein BXY66_1856 [Shimia isoporae]|uniref:Uncharacterized protein n=1 Tax=Shimia isoporae TaxID=647720 RepID=A0A4R1NPL8_9RHOB|nr:hypothetical protein [Shimia isoporae]TCL09791.1 hypothetical protein BXY66_1856 [Shimia isoporae]